MEKVDADKDCIQQHHGPGVAEHGVDQADKTAAHIDYAELYDRRHHHWDDNESRSDISENFEKDPIIVDKKIHTNLRKVN